MLTKIAAVVHSKIAIAVLGVVLVGGGGSAVAVAATTGHLTTLGVHLNASAPVAASDAKATETPDTHAHTVSVEGQLTACDAAKNQLSVTDSAHKAWTFTVSATTAFTGDANASHQGATSAKGDNSATTGGADTGGASSAHTALTLAQVCAFVNTRNVQVQATPQGASYDAWKVTLQGPGTGASDSKGDSTTSTSGSETSTGGSDNTPDAKVFEGTVTAVGASGFTLMSRGASYQVAFTASTALQGASAVGAILINSHAAVSGTLAGSTITATKVVVIAPDSASNSSGN